MDEKYMELALSLAKKGRGFVSPNPVVGAVIVKDGKIIGEGYHKRYGGPHAEVEAFNNISEEAEGATMYVTLEPCSHYGKTPPCADLIIEKKIAKVVIGILDPNPLVAGNGVKKLKDAGIEVKVGVLEKKCNKINEIFMKYISTKIPFVLMKTAMSLDGKISTYTGESRWISGEESRKQVHKLRINYSAIMVGVNTVVEDDPELTCRIEGGRNPIRIILDSNLRIPMSSKIVQSAKKVKTIVVATNNAPRENRIMLEKKGINILLTDDIDGRVNLKDLMKKLGELNIDSVLLEGGSTVNFSALEQGVVDKVQIYIAPMILGGDISKSTVGGKGVEHLKDAFKLKKLSTQYVGEDVLIEGYIEKRVENPCLQE
ncbi:bifunctional diaminohydroxyphosphoribosylaminopyrimidine deaminase/5-amino-6-(5-phosphoribosylamino)uracil reductase RibD [Clostridium sp. SHJSY1]|uniref:bifunctional diaminohydroxyphosphoribosylaminopyrimidine deaminase/5-amino-6-(5-phosphoribosylamino)uracil reductase RibD n=1 Tax=Clostridium sp. SHJSY1 TaxID=2942483 RepID=UPI00287495E3|nr:bifunctional diaminohydroxyphosphoribosylaminopyrimidine deaminase/5-amino-6-(5-phosphoribosylamino)uracil reductase RibD [Clostridium sp. SHJSY1]MDS0526935.1 bifunctional diaminohydroxyphosphoribosylaminopyrimidine deaminase/5-amino-6-(5-phosphoribosylamino)uracil reductase RibD [Clostridium sp. SHJSY1]